MTGKVFVTGDRGYIGSVLVPQLLADGYSVIGFDTDYYYDNFSEGLKLPEYPTIRKDIRKIEKRDFEGADSIIHLSALSNDPMGDIDAGLTEEINYRSTVRLAEMAKDAGVRRFLFSSSCSIYGIAQSGTVDESSPVNPLTAYARSKINSEKELARLSSDGYFVGLLRNSTVYGYSPNFRDDLVVNNLVVSALVNGELRVMSDGTPWRPLIDVRDLSTVFRRYLQTDDEMFSGRVVNIGFNENNVQVSDIVHYIAEELPSCPVRFTGEHGTDTRSYKVNFDLLHSRLGDIRQQWPLEKSIHDLIHHVRKMDKNALKQKKYTRIHTLKDLIRHGRIGKDLFWK